MNNLIKYGANDRRIAEAALHPNLFLARVISQYKDKYKVATEEEECLGEVSGKLRFEVTSISQYPAVGDFVMVDRTNGSSGNAIIQKVLTRSSLLERTDINNEFETQVIATNIEIVFICMSLNNDYNLSRLERYLSITWNSGATPVVVLTKSDLCDDLEAIKTEIEKVAPFTDILITSGYEKDSCDKLLHFLKKGKTASFIGSSGVGKSTLINKLAGQELLSTSAIREDDKGRHTTTRRDLLVLPQGGIVIDTPGMRELGADSVDLSRSFADVDALAEKCKFRDCTHEKEPGCAVLEAVEMGNLELRRLISYKKLKREAKYDGLNSKQIESEKLNAMFEEVGGMKNMKKFIKEAKKRKGN